jgi:hypothetical protein
MDAPSPSMRELAQRLLALEAAGPAAAESHGNEAVRVCDKLRETLTRFAGADGFTALLRRAVALARAEVPALQSVVVRPDGGLEGLEELAGTEPDGGARAAVAITAQLLGLLADLIGESLTRRLLRDTWPGRAMDE